MSEFRKYANVAISREHVWESKNSRIVERHARSEILRCSLERGSPEQRPTVSCVLGAVLVVPGVVFAGHLHAILFEGKFGYIRYELAMLLIGLIGVWLVAQSLLSRRYYLLIETKTARRKLVFAQSATPAGITGFLVEAEQSFGFSVGQHGGIHKSR